MTMKASELDPIGPDSFLFKGGNGFGKTLAAASFALAGPVYLAYFDKKRPKELREFFRRFGDKGQKILNNLEFDLYSSKNPHEFDNQLNKLTDYCPFTAVILDSVTTFTSAAVNW